MDGKGQGQHAAARIDVSSSNAKKPDEYGISGAELALPNNAM
jgi:hypothetical protein